MRRARRRVELRTDMTGMKMVIEERKGTVVVEMTGNELVTLARPGRRKAARREAIIGVEGEGRGGE